MSVNIKYNNNSIAALTDTGTKTLKTAGKYCESDIVVENTKDGGGATEPYVEETYDSSGNLTSAVMHGHSVVRRAAFYDCGTLTSVTIPNSVTRIDDNSFYNCVKLTSVTIPNGVTSIGNYTFYGCEALTSVTIPNSVTSICNHAFYNCKYLTSVTFNGTPSSIGSKAFGSCPKLTTINVPWAEGAVSGAPWGATNATINYDYTGA